MVVEVPSRKLPGFRFYKDVLGSPKYIVAPMVDQSELVRLVLAEFLTKLRSSSPNPVALENTFPQIRG